MDESSSIKMGALDNLSRESLMREKSSSAESLPVRNFHESTRESAASNLSTNWAELISRENIPTGVLYLGAVFLGISRAGDVLPIEGRAANITRSDFCRPASLLSKSGKPVGTHRISSFDLCRRSNLSHASVNVSFSEVKLCLVKVAISKSFLPALSRTLSTSSSLLYDNSEM